MTDRKLLELAAKAAGYKVIGLVDSMIAQPDHRTGGLVVRNEHGGDSCWDPLTDDGDALRLAVKLGFDLMLYSAIKGAFHGATGEQFAEDERNSDPYAATRRAIVRAAAAIGEAMP